jgi:hypothetical protein
VLPLQLPLQWLQQDCQHQVLLLLLLLLPGRVCTLHTILPAAGSGQQQRLPQLLLLPGTVAGHYTAASRDLSSHQPNLQQHTPPHLLLLLLLVQLWSPH